MISKFVWRQINLQKKKVIGKKRAINKIICFHSKTVLIVSDFLRSTVVEPFPISRARQILMGQSLL